MTKQELIQKLRATSIYVGGYNLDGLPSEGWGIERLNGAIRVCYVERGEVTWEHSCSSESEAYQALWDEIFKLGR